MSRAGKSERRKGFSSAGLKTSRLWESFRQRGSGVSIMYFPPEIVAGHTCSGLRESNEWEKCPQWYPFFHHSSITEECTANTLEKKWKGLPLSGLPPKNFLRDCRRAQKNGYLGYLLVPTEGLLLTCTNGAPTISASDIEELARLNGREVAHPGQARVFEERPSDDDNGDSLDMSYFVTPSIFL